LKYVERAARDIAETVTEGNKIVVEKSTVPVKAAESIATILSANKKPGVSYQVHFASIEKDCALKSGVSNSKCLAGSIKK
jgi:UDP-glucose 6-dehydrogenase